MGSGEMHDFTERELQIVESLKTRSIKETANHFNVTRGTIDKTLFRVRNKIEKAQGSVNISASWKDSKRNPRLAKLLRRQVPLEEEKPDE
jgi:transposase